MKELFCSKISTFILAILQCFRLFSDNYLSKIMFPFIGLKTWIIIQILLKNILVFIVTRDQNMINSPKKNCTLKKKKFCSCRNWYNLAILLKKRFCFIFVNVQWTKLFNKFDFKRMAWLCVCKLYTHNQAILLKL